MSRARKKKDFYSKLLVKNPSEEVKARANEILQEVILKTTKDLTMVVCTQEKKLLADDLPKTIKFSLKTYNLDPFFVLSYLGLHISVLHTNVNKT